MEKILWFDLETTGLKYWKNGIHQIAGIITIDGEVKEKFNYHVQPNPSATIEQEALDVAGVTVEQVQNYPFMLNVYKEFVSVIAKYVDKYNKKDKMFLAGYNSAAFDNEFLRAFFTQCKDNYFGSYFYSGAIDVMVLANDYLKKSRNHMFNFKLFTVAEYLGIQVDKEKLHDALYDIEITMQIYNKISIRKCSNCAAII